MEKIRNFQCTVCLVYFDDQLSHKSHYKTQWHTFNLMRKQIDKSPIRLDQYDELIKLQNDSSETKEKIPCIICNKRFENIKSFNNHVKSKKHLSLGKIFKARKVDVDSNSVSLKKDDVETGKTCLFCTLNFSSNDYMSHLKKHSFIPPNSDQLIDRDGLITLLHELVHVAFQCIYCCKLFSNSEAVKNHMDNTGHKNIPFDTIEECEDSVFYQFYHKSGTEIVIYGEEYEDEVLDDGTDEYKMVLPSGIF
ncbi:hypothetical protein A3Q56_00992 [Intoshia linei]|uniref:C2H2-type domain-containing protein n=1 Tax=Intoshia linei TaxID=1819745 RepID=A0A177BCK5_9BILA|nr:hypothetical protein A3Q56_00992 [Intoshia linei]